MVECCEKLQIPDDLAVGAAVGEYLFGPCRPQAFSIFVIALGMRLLKLGLFPWLLYCGFRLKRRFKSKAVKSLGWEN